MRISDWSSDVCSSDLPEGDRWRGCAMTLDPFYPIVDSAAWLRRLLPLGIKLVQLRVKDRSEAETRAEIGAARDLCAAAGGQLLVNAYCRIALDAGFASVHLRQEGPAGPDLPAPHPPRV